MTAFSDSQKLKTWSNHHNSDLDIFYYFYKRVI